MATQQTQTAPGKPHSTQQRQDMGRQSADADFPADVYDNDASMDSSSSDLGEFAIDEAGTDEINTGPADTSEADTGEESIDEPAHASPGRGELEHNLAVLQELERKDAPLFDQSIDSIDPDEADSTKRESRRPQSVEEDAGSDDTAVYNDSLDGPGTNDLH